MINAKARRDVREPAKRAGNSQIRVQRSCSAQVRKKVQQCRRKTASREGKRSSEPKDKDRKKDSVEREEKIRNDKGRRKAGALVIDGLTRGSGEEIEG